MAARCIRQTGRAYVATVIAWAGGGMQKIDNERLRANVLVEKGMRAATDMGQMRRDIIAD